MYFVISDFPQSTVACLCCSDNILLTNFHIAFNIEGKLYTIMRSAEDKTFLLNLTKSIQRHGEHQMPKPAKAKRLLASTYLKKYFTWQKWLIAE